MRRAALLLVLALAQAKVRFSGRRAREGSYGALADAHNNLVDSLRRQLMHDNYDYLTSGNDDPPARAPPLYDAGPAADDDDYFPEPARPRRARPRARPRGAPSRRRLRPRARPAERAPQDTYRRVESRVPVSDKDLYYYMDDARLTGGDARAFNALDVADAPDNDFDDDGPPAAAPRKKKYTILEIEGGDGTRRSGRGGRRRFVQEEGDDGIAIVSLDNGPFPEFRLPTDRRQYMHHQYTDDAPNPPPDEPSSQRRRGHSLEYAQQEDELLYLS